MSRISAVLATALIALALLAPSAEAASRLCRQLEARLADVSSGGGSRETRRYDRAIRDQENQLDRAYRQLSRAGCSGGFSLFGRGDGSACPVLERTIERMEGNLRQLERRRSQLGRGGVDRRERARILASLEVNGCRDGGREREPEVIAREQGGNIFDQLFGGGMPRRQRLEDYEESMGRTIVRDYGGYGDYDYRGGGTYRTLCVRTCDGYYFPISHASSPEDFHRDAQNCQSMCPGSEVRLFSHRVPGQESEEMVAENGMPYAELPNAFRYREPGFVRPPGCGCGADGGPKNFTVIAGETPAEEPPVDPAAVVVPPLPRPDPAADPETAANRNGGLDPETIRELLSKEKPAAEIGTGERRVRVVGPVFLPDPEDGLDLRAPARTTIQ